MVKTSFRMYSTVHALESLLFHLQVQNMTICHCFVMCVCVYSRSSICSVIVVNGNSSGDPQTYDIIGFRTVIAKWADVSWSCIFHKCSVISWGFIPGNISFHRKIRWSWSKWIENEMNIVYKFGIIYWLK